MKKLLSVLLSTMMLLSLAGCSGSGFLFRSPESLYALPRLSDEYTSLQTALQELLDQGMEYSPPLSGSTTQPVHLRDLDGDGEDEAVAFLRHADAAETPLKMYIFKKNTDGLYETACVIAGDGSNFNSAESCQMLGDEDSPLELVISWQVSSSLNALSVYSLANYQPVEILSCPSYTRYCCADLDEDGEEEMVVMRLDLEDGALHTANYYDKENDQLSQVGMATLSSSISSIDRIQSGLLSDGAPALYVTGTMLNDLGASTSQVTDVLTLTDEGLINLTLNPATLNSDDTIRYNLTGVQDINGDGVLEIPSPYTLPALDPNAPADSFYGISWQQFSSRGSSSFVCSTFYNSADGWYLELPEDWQGHIALARQDISVGSTSERGIIFYYRDGESKGKPFLAVYKNTGSNQENRSIEGNRIFAGRDNSATYSMEVLDTNSELTVSPGELEERFYLIQTDWSAD